MPAKKKKKLAFAFYLIKKIVYPKAISAGEFTLFYFLFFLITSRYYFSTIGTAIIIIVLFTSRCTIRNALVSAVKYNIITCKVSAARSDSIYNLFYLNDIHRSPGIY